MRGPRRFRCVAVVSSVMLTLVWAGACGAKHPLGDEGTVMQSSLTRGAACDRSDQDPSRYIHVPLYRACAVSVQARPVSKDVRPEFRPPGRDRSCFSATIEVVVDTAGRAEVRTARLLKATDPVYGHAVLEILPALRFDPAQLGGRRVRQIYELREVLLVRRGARWFGPSTRTAASGSRTGAFGRSGGGASSAPGSQPGSQLPPTGSAPPVC